MGAALVSLVIDSNADVDAVTSSKTTPLHLASSKGHSDIVGLLVTAKANPNLRDKHGGNALIRAAGAGRQSVLKLLLDAKANVKLKDSAGDNAFHAAINGQNVGCCEILFGQDDAEAMMGKENEDGKTPTQLLLDMQPIEMRDPLKSVWRATHGS